MASSTSSPPATLQYLSPPPGFAAVQVGVYRCGALPPGSFSFVRRLGLRTALWLSNEHPVRALTTFFEDTNTTFIHLGLRTWAGRPYAAWRPISEELIKEALELVLDASTHPVMVMCASGIHHTGTLVGCLRRLEKWNLTSVIEEYRRHAGSKARYVNEQFIELFDEDLVTLPRNLPGWFLDQRAMMEEEEREYEAMSALRRETDERESGSESEEARVEGGEGTHRGVEGGEREELKFEERECVGGRAGNLLGGVNEGERAVGADGCDLNKDKTDDVIADGSRPQELEAHHAPVSSSMQTSSVSVSVSVTDEPPGYRKYYYSRSSPLTTEDREYKRKIIGKV